MSVILQKVYLNYNVVNLLKRTYYNTIYNLVPLLFV